MKFFIVFAATVACALAETAVLPGGYLADAPDVAAAKIAHFEEKAKAAAAAGVAPDYVTSYYLNYYKSFGQNGYAPAAITVLPSGYLADTPEVAAAKSEHFAEHAKAAYASTPIAAPTAFIPPASNEYLRYASPFSYAPASITVLPNGYLADTPEVAAAKSAHIAEHAKAAYAAGPLVAPAAFIPPASNEYLRNASPFSYAPASITVLPNGYLADTPEVAAAKAAFFAEQARADSSVVPSAVIPSNSNYRYASSFAPASITVLPSGFLADTPEVAAAKSAHLAEVARASVPDPYYNEYYTWNGDAWVPNQ